MLRAASGAVTELETRDSGSGCLHNPGLRGETSRVLYEPPPHSSFMVKLCVSGYEMRNKSVSHV